MTNEPNKTDFFPVSDEQLKDLIVSYQDTEEDLRHKEYLKKLETTIFENSDKSLEEDLGELPFDEKADRQRWDELETEFDRVFLNESRRAD